MPKFSERGAIHLLPLLILGLGIVAGVYLIVTGNLKLFSRATNPPVVFKSIDGQALAANADGIPQTTSPKVKIEFTSTLGTPVFASPSPSPSAASSPSPSPSQSPASVSSSRVFVTSTTYNGNLGGLTGADLKCQARADTANLGGVWKAWLSDSNTSVIDRLVHNSGPYKLLNGTIIADNWTDLTDRSIQNRIDITELNTVRDLVNPANRVWTNTNANGDRVYSDSSYTCNDWSTASANDTYTGNSGFADSNWTIAESQSCSNGLRLYCFEQVGPARGPTEGASSFAASPEPSPTPAAARRAPRSAYERILERMGLWDRLNQTLGVSTSIDQIQVGGTTHFKFAESPADLDQASGKPYTQDPMVEEYEFKDKTAGVKTIWVEFKDVAGKVERRSASVEIVSAVSSSPSPSPVSQETKVISYEAFTLRKPNGEQNIVQSIIADNAPAVYRYCTVGIDEINCSNSPGSWVEPKTHLPEGSGPIISYGAFAYYTGIEQKVVQTITTGNGKNYSRTCNVVGDDVDWEECSKTLKWAETPLSAPDGSGVKMLSYGAFSLIWFDSSKNVTKQKVVQSMIMDNGNSWARTCSVEGGSINCPKNNDKENKVYDGWTLTPKIDPPDGSPAKVISYGAFAYYASERRSSGDGTNIQQKVVQTLLADDGNSYSRVCNVGSDDVDWKGCSTWSNPPVKLPYPESVSPPARVNSFSF